MPWHSCWQLFAIIGVVGMAVSLYGEEPTNAEPATPDKPAASEPRVTVAIARDRAKLMHQVYASTLEVMHDRYFHDERAIVPARALEDVFVEISKQSKIKARWISVNTKPMSLHHEPKSDFEKQAATELGAGKGEFERVEKGFYLRAAPIPLTSGCVSCHTGFFAGPPKTPRFAGLVISVPVDEE
ncbi:MAG TPA: DUF3365 domain-containing protein [Pirellulaceae bacterium]|nr:DUF3365 domain-containing protein [Pirellulaceae bacterium]